MLEVAVIPIGGRRIYEEVPLVTVRSCRCMRSQHAGCSFRQVVPQEEEQFQHHGDHIKEVEEGEQEAPRK